MLAAPLERSARDVASVDSPTRSLISKFVADRIEIEAARLRCGPASARVPSNAWHDAGTHAHVGLCVQIGAERWQARPRPDFVANYL